MSGDVLTVRVERDPAGTLRILSPKVGVWTHHPHPGAVVGPGSRVGELVHLERRYALVLPDGVAGRLFGEVPRDRAVPVEYGAQLFALAPLGDADRAGLAQERRAVSGASEGVPEGQHAVVAPTDGVFYSRPAPGAPPFVEPGARVRQGSAIGLIEVMKTFSRIEYGGPGLPEEAEVVEVRASDSAEVRAGDVLVVVRA